jgi:hypothetical protein
VPSESIINAASTTDEPRVQVESPAAAAEEGDDDPLDSRESKDDGDNENEALPSRGISNCYGLHSVTIKTILVATNYSRLSTLHFLRMEM